MPLRDHFRPSKCGNTESERVYGGWPMVIVQQIHPELPKGYSAAPKVHRGPLIEVDVAGYESMQYVRGGDVDRNSNDDGGIATAVWAPPKPILDLKTEILEDDEYEVRIYDDVMGRVLVAAIEIVSPANKDRPDSRRAFVEKCGMLLKKGVSVSIVDLVTNRHFNLYSELMQSLGHEDPAFEFRSPSIYAATCRLRRFERDTRLGTWAFPLQIGEALPQLPIWLNDETHIMVELEESYEATCRVLDIQ